MSKVSIAGVLRLRARSTVLRDKSVTRSAQDVDFVGILTKTSQRVQRLWETGLQGHFLPGTLLTQTLQLVPFTASSCAKPRATREQLNDQK
jgi:hypothetical protein